MNLAKRSNGYYYILFTDDFNKRKAISTKCNNKQDALKFLSNFKAELHARQLLRQAPVSFEEYRKRFLDTFNFCKK